MTEMNFTTCYNQGSSILFKLDRLENWKLVMCSHLILVFIKSSYVFVSDNSSSGIMQTFVCWSVIIIFKQSKFLSEINKKEKS
jgi:hypothetical protein